MNKGGEEDKSKERKVKKSKEKKRKGDLIVIHES